MVIYAILSGVSVGALFLSGVIPGLLMAVSLMLLIAWIGAAAGSPTATPCRSANCRACSAARSSRSRCRWCCSAVSGAASSRRPKPPRSRRSGRCSLASASTAISEPRRSTPCSCCSARQSTVVMMLIVSSFIVNFALEREGVAQGLAAWITGFNLSPLGFQLAVNVMFLVLGTVLDGAVMLLVFVPVLLPAAKSLGIDLVHFGLVVILNFMIAQITPPYGLILFVLSALTGVPMREINREIWQFCVPLTIVLLLLIAFPAITLWLPWTFGYKG